MNIVGERWAAAGPLARLRDAADRGYGGRSVVQRRRSAFVPRDPVCSFACRRSLAGASCGGAGQLLIINSAEPGEQGRVQVVYLSIESLRHILMDGRAHRRRGWPAEWPRRQCPSSQRLAARSGPTTAPDEGVIPQGNYQITSKEKRGTLT